MGEVKYMLRVHISGDVVILADAGKPVQFGTANAAMLAAAGVLAGGGQLYDLTKLYADPDNYYPEEVALLLVAEVDSWNMLDEHGRPQKVAPEKLPACKGKASGLSALEERKKTAPLRTNNSSLPAGSPMYFYCRLCGHESDKLPEAYTGTPKALCANCQELKDRGWVDDANT